jgi:hypothetical protein
MRNVWSLTFIFYLFPVVSSGNWRILLFAPPISCPHIASLGIQAGWNQFYVRTGSSVLLLLLFLLLLLLALLSDWPWKWRLFQHVIFLQYIGREVFSCLWFAFKYSILSLSKIVFWNLSHDGRDKKLNNIQTVWSRMSWYCLLPFSADSNSLVWHGNFVMPALFVLSTARKYCQNFWTL